MMKMLLRVRELDDDGVELRVQCSLYRPNCGQIPAGCRPSQFLPNPTNIVIICAWSTDNWVIFLLQSCPCVGTTQQCCRTRRSYIFSVPFPSHGTF